MLTLVRATVSTAQEEGAVKRLSCSIVSECWDLWHLQVQTPSTRTSVIREPSTSSWVNWIKAWHTHQQKHCTGTCVQYTHPCCIFSGILMQTEASPDEDDVVTLEIKSDIQLILSVLCESDMHRKVKLRLWPLNLKLQRCVTFMWL